MQRRTNLQISSIIILMGIFTICIEFGAYHFLKPSYLVWGISCIASIICCHVLLSQSGSYEACYCYSLLTIFMSLSMTALSYLGEARGFLPYSWIMPGLVIINWLIPLLHCLIRYIVDYGTRIEDFIVFYRNISIIFIIFYLSIILYSSFAPGAFEWAYPIKRTQYNLLPFEIIATLIEDKLYGKIPLSDITAYLLPRIAIFMPYGFYIRLILFKKTRLIRIISFLLFPLLLELLQYFIIPSRCDIDDIIYGVIGSLLGSLFFALFNFIVRAISGKDFLIKNDRFYHGSLRF